MSARKLCWHCATEMKFQWRAGPRKIRILGSPRVFTLWERFLLLYAPSVMPCSMHSGMESGGLQRNSSGWHAQIETRSVGHFIQLHMNSIVLTSGPVVQNSVAARFAQTHVWKKYWCFAEMLPISREIIGCIKQTRFFFSSYRLYTSC
jgi:hypothetical protein